ncbi:putative E3 ubiquitin-protein ligase XBAT35 [Lycium barbarum]|uniref:putative E3 ubiquitin-protein ligase XBAT35 n=1 Tax=Lycium barbarum TaxID=112863 RepID=UPI00293E3547|nr:putative E3 ubiquitin-protein ligase XBAT35 [Lycium barbarum]
MDGSDRVVRRRKSLTERLGFTGPIACCGATLCLRPASLSVVDDDNDDGEESLQAPPESAEVGSETPPEIESALLCLANIPTGSGMNLAAALAAERNFRSAQDSDGATNSSPTQGPNTSPLRPNDNGPGSGQGTPFRVSLMRLLEETNGWDEKEEIKDGVGNDTICCVCMGRKKGAAFIPCGHTYCRVCSRELWLNRGYCPLCNRSILEILDIY